jgi:hypothetical protein
VVLTTPISNTKRPRRQVSKLQAENEAKQLNKIKKIKNLNKIIFACYTLNI